MSTVFDVLPGTRYMPNVGEVVSGTDQLLHEFLQGHDIKHKFQINFEILEEKECANPERQSLWNRLLRPEKKHTQTIRRTPSEAEPFWWEQNQYGWLSIEGVAGGCDCYVEEPLQPWSESNWLDAFDAIQAKGQREIPIDVMYKTDREWSFRRSIWEPALITISYGFLAAQVARLTKGIIYTIDGAWRSNQLPAYADDFIEFYFQPDHPANDSYDREWALKCIEEVRSQVNVLS